MSSLSRHERRKLDAEHTKKGFDPLTPTIEHLASLARVLQKLVATAKTRSNVFPLVDGLYSLAAKSQQSFADVPIACRKGCSHCCNTWVDCSAPELLFLQRSLPPGHATIDDRIAAFQSQWGKLDFDGRGNLVTPCPLLDQDLCAVYPARPLNCRLAVSTDAEICQRSYVGLSGEDVPTPAVYILTRGAYSQALSAALKHEGLPHRSYELASALAVLRAVPDAEKRWFAGEDVFANAMLAPHVDVEPLVDNIATAAFGE